MEEKSIVCVGALPEAGGRNLKNNSRIFKQELNWFDCSAIIVGIIIGTGIFSAFPRLIAERTMSAGAILLSWLAGGLFAWFGALCYAELSSLFPEAGGDYAYLRNIYSHKGENFVSFLFAWSQILVIRPSAIAALALIFAEEARNLLLSFSAVRGGIAAGNLFLAFFVDNLILAFLALNILTLANVTDLKISKWFQNLLSVIKILAIVAIIGFGLYKTSEFSVNLFPIFPSGDKNIFILLANFWSALVLTMWVYGGWNEAAYVAEETKDVYRNIPKALFAGIFVVTLIYLGINFVYIKHLSVAGLAGTWSPASSLMDKWFPACGGRIMSGIIIISALGAMNALTLTGGRVSYAIAKDFPSLREFAGLDNVRRTPVKALWANFIISAFLICLSRGKVAFVESLTFYTAGVFWYFFGLVVISLILLRKRIPIAEIPFKVPLYPFSPILFLIVTAGLVWGSIDYKPVETLTCTSILLLGIPVYYYLNTPRLKNKR